MSKAQMLVDAKTVDGADEKNFAAGQVIEGADADVQIALGHAVEFDEVLQAAKDKLGAAQAEFDAALASAGSRAEAATEPSEAPEGAESPQVGEDATEPIPEPSQPSEETVTESDAG